MKMKNKKRYKIICPYCKRTQYTCKNIQKELGPLIGCAACFYYNEIYLNKKERNNENEK